jgi:hypothetical protein
MPKTQVTSVTTRPHPISNTFHLVMTICTGGLWLPVWWFMARGHKETTRVTMTDSDTPAPPPPAPGIQQADALLTTAGLLAPPAAGTSDPEIGWGTQMMRDMIAAGSTKAQARHAVVDEVRRRSAG